MSSRIGLSLNRDKSKQMTWPLSSSNSKRGIEQYGSNTPIQRKIVGNRGTGTFYPRESEEASSLFSGKTVEVTIQRGTKRIKRQLNSLTHSPISNNRKHVCDTCQCEIGDEISRVIIMRDKDGGPHLLCFHYFFPCWDMNLLCQKYPHLIIDKLRFTFPKDLKITKRSIEDMKNDLRFWN